MSINFDSRESIMREWDRWRKYIANGGEGSWPRDAFESLLDYYDEKLQLPASKDDPKRSLAGYTCSECGYYWG